MEPAGQPAGGKTEASQLDRIEAKLDWLHIYLTTQLAKPWARIPPWPAGGKTEGAA